MVIGYGVVQSVAPQVLRRRGGVDEIAAARSWAFVLGVVSASSRGVTIDDLREAAVLGGLIVFGIVFAELEPPSYLILAYAGRDDDVSMDVGFYYSANASGRLVGTLLSGLLYLGGGLELAMWGSAAFAGLTWLLTLRLPLLPTDTAEASAATAG